MFVERIEKRSWVMFLPKAWLVRLLSGSISLHWLPINRRLLKKLPIFYWIVYLNLILSIEHSPPPPSFSLSLPLSLCVSLSLSPSCYIFPHLFIFVHISLFLFSTSLFSFSPYYLLSLMIMPTFPIWFIPLSFLCILSHVYTKHWHPCSCNT